MIIKNNLKNKALFLLRCFIALIPIVWIFYRIKFSDLISAFHKTQPWLIPVVTILIIITMFMQGFRWWVLMKAFIGDLSFIKTMSYHFTGIFYSIILPTSAGGDIVRTILISRNIDYSIGWGATWICRILGLLTLFILSLFGLTLIDKSLLPYNLRFYFYLFFGVILLFFILSFSKKTTRPFRNLLQKILPLKILEVIEKIRDGVYNYKSKVRNLFTVFIITFITHFLVVFATSIVIKGITGNFYLIECFAFIPIIEIISISLPLTPNGIGIREGLTALMFKQLHLSNEQLGVYVLIGFYVLTLRLLGGIPLLYGFLKTKKED